MNSEYQHQVSQPIIFKRGTSLAAPVLLWLMDALPAVLAGVMFYPLCALLRRRLRQALRGAVDPRGDLHARGAAAAQSTRRR